MARPRQQQQDLRLHTQVIDQISDAIIATDEAVRVTFWNDAAARLYGVPAAEAIGRPLSELYTYQWSTPADEAAAWRSLQATGEWRGENVHVRRDGRRIIVESVVTAVPSIGKLPAGLIASIRDVTERRRAEAQLREADRQEGVLLAMLAHELRNPLAPIRTSVAVLGSSGISDAARDRCHAVIERQVSHMATLLDDLLDVSRLSTGKLVLQRVPLLIHEVIDLAVETSRPSIDDRGHRLILDIATEPLVVEGDRARLAQTVANLLNNAAKYTNPGGEIHLSSHQDGNTVVIRVRDSGIGIAPEHLSRVFDLFTQLEQRRDSTHTGLGIGLALAKQLVGLHGGYIEVRSDGLGHGSEFAIALPLLDHQAPGRDHAVHIASPPLQIRVVVADDNVDAADTIAMLLEPLGCDVRTAYGGEAAVREVLAFKPHVVLLDLGMPDVDGFEACRRMREAGAHTSIVALTGWGQDDDRRRTTTAGFDAHLVKPVDPDALVKFVEELARSKA